MKPKIASILYHLIISVQISCQYELDVADRNNKIVYANHGDKTDSTAIEEIQKQLIPVIDEALRGK